MILPTELTVKIFADGADLDTIRALKANPLIRGFTTNPTLMRKAGILDYAGFAKQAIDIVGGLPISFEVFADEIDEMERQARTIATWGQNVYVKIPISNTRRQSTTPLVKLLSEDGIQVNITAIMTLEQVRDVASAIRADVPSYVSIFAGRIADTGRDPLPIMLESRTLLAAKPAAEIIWASPREVLNVWHAESVGCHVITATPDLLAKLKLAGKSLDDYSQETVQMFYDDASKAGFQIS